VPDLSLAVASIPVKVPRCRNLGLVAVNMALAGVQASLRAAVMGAKGKMGRDLNAHWWVVGALVLAIPGVAVLFIVYAG
jgi:hypothetical protein